MSAVDGRPCSRDGGIVAVTKGAWGWSSEALELCVGGGRARPSYGQGCYAVVPPRAPDIIAISALQISPPHGSNRLMNKIGTSMRQVDR